MRKLGLAIMAGLLVMSLAACGTKDGSGKNTESTAPVQSETTTDSGETTETSSEPSEGSTGESTQETQEETTETTESTKETEKQTESTTKPEPTEKPEPTKAPEPTKKPEPTRKPDPTKTPEPTKNPEPTKAPEPTAKPETTEPADTTDPEGDPEEVSVNDLYEAITAAYGDDYIPVMKIDEETAEEVYGVKKEWYDDFIGEQPMISTHVDSVLIFRASDGHAGDIEKALLDRKDYLVNESFQYPMNMPKVKAADIKVYDDYVFFIMLGGYPDDQEPKDEEEALEFAKQNNQIAIDAIEKLLK